MKKVSKVFSAIAATFVLSALSSICMSAETGSLSVVIKQIPHDAALFFVNNGIFAVIGLALAAAACGLGQAKAVAAAVESIARQPEASSKIQTAMLLGLAFIESLVIYVLVLGLILLFANPFVQYFIGK